jgi:hypothetical protein
VAAAAAGLDSCCVCTRETCAGTVDSRSNVPSLPLPLPPPHPTPPRQIHLLTHTLSFFFALSLSLCLSLFLSLYRSRYPHRSCAALSRTFKRRGVSCQRLQHF